MYLNNSSASDIARLQDEVNTGMMGQLPVIIGSLSYLPGYDISVHKDITDKDTAVNREGASGSQDITEAETKAFLKDLFNAGIILLY